MSAVPNFEAAHALRTAPVPAPRVRPVRACHLHLVPSAEAVSPERISGNALTAGLGASAGGAATPAPRAGGVYVRRRFAAMLALLVLVAGAVLAARAVASPEPGPAAPAVTVRDGETLSQIAARELPAVRVDQAVVAIAHENNLGSTHVQAGQRLLIPSR